MSELDLPPSEDDLDGDGELDDAPKPEGVVGRIVEPDEGAAPDVDAEVLGEETEDAANLTAEEAAMHIVEP